MERVSSNNSYRTVKTDSSGNPYSASLVNGSWITGVSGKMPSALDNSAVSAFHNGTDAVKTSFDQLRSMFDRAKSEGLVPAVVSDLKSFSGDVKKAVYGDNEPSGYWQTVMENASLPSVNLSSSSGSARASSGFGLNQDASAPVENPMQWYIDLINQTTDKNNAWSAEQAQKQMDFQERMARNAHQYEVEDLKAAGLNPILSASGGNGASAPSGAMATPDTSNTRLLAELSLANLDSIGNSAVQLASASGSRSANSFKNKLFGIAEKYVLPTMARVAATAVTKKIFG